MRFLKFHVFYSDQNISCSINQFYQSLNTSFNSYKLQTSTKEKFPIVIHHSRASADTKDGCEEFLKDLKIPSKGNSTLRDKCGAMHI